MTKYALSAVTVIALPKHNKNICRLYPNVLYQVLCETRFSWPNKLLFKSIRATGNANKINGLGTFNIR